MIPTGYIIKLHFVFPLCGRSHPPEIAIGFNIWNKCNPSTVFARYNVMLIYKALFDSEARDTQDHELIEKFTCFLRSLPILFKRFLDRPFC